METLFHRLRLLVVLLLVSGCARYTCPAYISAFQYDVNPHPREFFAYFNAEEEGDAATASGYTASGESFLDMVEEPAALEPAVVVEDSFFNDHGMLVFAEGEEPAAYAIVRTSKMNKNGLMKKTRGGRGKMFWQKPKRKNNFPRQVNMKNPRPLEIPEEGDTTQQHQLVQKKEPPKSIDQLIYEMQFGDPNAVDSSAVEEEEGETAEGADEELTPKEARKKKRREKREERRKRRQERKNRKKGGEEPAGLNEEVAEPAEEETPEDQSEKKKKKKNQETASVDNY